MFSSITWCFLSLDDDDDDEVVPSTSPTHHLFSLHHTASNKPKNGCSDAQGPNHPENADHLDDGIDTNLADGTNDAWIHEKNGQIGGSSQEMMLDSLFILFNYVEDS